MASTTTTKKNAVCSAFSLSSRPLNRYELKGHRAVVDSGGRVRGHGNRLINKVLHDFTISVRGRLIGVVTEADTHINTKPDGKVKPRSEVCAAATGGRVTHDESSQRWTQPGLLILLLRGIMGSHEAGQGVTLSEFQGRTAAVPPQPSHLLQHSLVVLHNLHPSPWEQ